MEVSITQSIYSAFGNRLPSVNNQRFQANKQVLRATKLFAILWKMESPCKPPSRWGSLLQQAVAGVESRLDTILADEDSQLTNSALTRQNATEQHTKKDNVDLSAASTNTAGQ